MAVLGVDGCPTGWFSVRIGENEWNAHVYPSVRELWAEQGDCELVLIDIPIGLPNREMPRRNCDVEARAKLGFPRRSSVFSPPGQAAFNAGTHLDASEANRNELGVGLSLQSWTILPKIQEVDDFLIYNVPARHIFRECHPELCFWGLNGFAFGARGAVNPSKKSRVGRHLRRNILRNSGPPNLADEIYNFAMQEFPRRSVAKDDIVDAIAAAFTAMLGPDDIVALPCRLGRQLDEHDLPMEMVYPRLPN